jgi:LCP family protein required for cell wall assembly
MANHDNKNEIKDGFVDISSNKQVNKIYKKKGRAIRITAIVLSVFLLIGGSGLIYYYSVLNSLKFVDISDNTATATKATTNADSTSDDIFDKSLSNDELLEDSKVLNVMLFGEDNARGEKFGRSDSMIMLSIDNRHKKLKMTSFQRDSYVYVDGYGYDKLTNAYAYGGPKLTIQTIESNFGVKVDRYAVVDYASFIDIIDVLGGIDLELTKDEIDYINYQLYKNKQSDTRTTITDAPGVVHLTGQQALWYARNRGLDSSEEEIGIAGDDWDRTSRQRKLLETMFNDMKSADLTQIVSIVGKVGPLVTTNIKKDEITALVSHSPTYLTYSVEQYTVPQEGQWYYMNDTPVGSVIAFSDLEVQRKLFAEFIYEELVTGGTSTTKSN